MLMRVSVKLAEPQHYIFWSLWACMCAHACMSWTRPSLFARHTTHSAPPSHGCSPTSAAAFLAVPSPWPWLCRYSSLLKCSIHWTGKYVRGYVRACVCSRLLVVASFTHPAQHAVFPGHVLLHSDFISSATCTPPLALSSSPLPGVNCTSPFTQDLPRPNTTQP